MNKQGLIQVFYGNGKGKTSIAVGSIIRALNYTDKICLFKFFKIKNNSGEDKILESLNVEIYFSEYKHPFFYYNNITESLKNKIFEYQKEMFLNAAVKISEEYDLVVLDEVLDLIKENIITNDDLLKCLKKKNKKTNVILTGHYIDNKIIEYADLVSEVSKIKHYYDTGIVNVPSLDF